MEIRDVIDGAREGRWSPVLVLTGSERFLIDRAVGLLRAACLGDGIPGFNDDVFDGQGLAAAAVTGAARTLPMMAAARFVLVRSADAMAAAELDRLGEYVASPSPSTCVVILAEKLDGRTRLAREAKKADALVTVGPLKGGAVRSFVTAEARSRKHTIAGPAVEALVDATGEDLSTIDDALERLSLYVGPEAAITLDAVEQCVTRVRTESIWALVDAISASDARAALRAAASLLADREAPLRILGMIARQLRIVARMRQELAAGADERDAAVAAGAPPFKARELKEAARRFGAPRLAHAFDVLLRADRDLKGSRVPPDVVLEEAVLRLCRPDETRRARIQRRLPSLASR